ncbi:MAG TPA: glycosyl transferase, partial [Friedmanniella sp.]
VTGLTFSLMEGTYHDYYVVALAPAIAAGVTVAATVLWHRSHTWLGRVGLALGVTVTAGWAFVLLGRATGVYATLRWPVLVVGVLAALGLLVANRLPRVAGRAVLAVALASAVTGPAAYALNTVATPHTGSIVTAGPVRSQGGPGGGGRGGFGQGQTGGDGRTRTGDGTPPQGQTGQGQAPTQGQAPGQGQAGRTGGGGPGEGGASSTALTQLLQGDAGSHRWAAATIGSQSAATYQLASAQPVMAIGGFTGSDPSPTLAQFQAYVAAGDVHYFISGGGGGGRGGRGDSSEITTWVTQHYTATTVGGATVYDLTKPAS